MNFGSNRNRTDRIRRMERGGFQEDEPDDEPIPEGMYALSSDYLLLLQTKERL